MGKQRALGLAIVLAIPAAISAGCGSDGEDTAAAGGIPSDTANRLAEISDEISASLENGDVCGAAARADDLKAAVSEARIPAELRPEAEAGADQLVNVVNCDAEPETTTTEEEGDEEKKADEQSDESSEHDKGKEAPDSSGPPGQEKDFAPPGQAELKGGI